MQFAVVNLEELKKIDPAYANRRSSDDSQTLIIHKEILDRYRPEEVKAMLVIDPLTDEPIEEPYPYPLVEGEKVDDMPSFIDDDKALKHKKEFDTWESKIGKSVKKGKRLFYKDALYRVMQDHTVLEIYPPSINTASLYEEINEFHAGTKEDPIPYNNNTRLEAGKFYIQKEVIYKCTRDTGNPVYNDLADLVDIYVKIIE